MVKNLLLILAGLLMGYFLYPTFNPPAESGPNEEHLRIFQEFLTKEGRNFADAKTAEEKLKAADELYEKMMVLFLANLGLEAPKNKPLQVKLEITKTKDEVIERPLPMPLPQIIKPVKAKPKAIAPELKNLAAMIHSSNIDFRVLLKFRDLETLNPEDARIQKLLGKSTGTVDFGKDQRVDQVQKASFEVGKTPAKIIMNVLDSYDNENEGFSFTYDNLQVFKEVPGDANLIFINLTNLKFLVLDIRNFPEIEGKYFNSNKMIATLKLKKK